MKNAIIMYEARARERAKRAFLWFYTLFIYGLRWLFSHTKKQPQCEALISDRTCVGWRSTHCTADDKSACCVAEKREKKIVPSWKNAQI